MLYIILTLNATGIAGIDPRFLLLHHFPGNYRPVTAYNRSYFSKPLVRRANKRTRLELYALSDGVPKK